MTKTNQPRLRRCRVCQFLRREHFGVMCGSCCRAKERANLTGDNASLIEWVAKRAIRFERKRIGAVLEAGVELAGKVASAARMWP
jgi:hypothetical protein